jgi:hypothetical protein
MRRRPTATAGAVTVHRERFVSEILKDPGKEAAAARRAPAPLTEWERVRPLLAVTGAMLVVAGVVDIALLWYPPRFGEADWEFGTIAQSLDALPLPTVGLTLLAAGALLAGWRRVVWAVTAACALATLWLLASAIIFLLDVPQALRVMENDPRMGPGLRRVLFKAAVFFVSYGVGFVLATLLMWRRARRLGSEPGGAA